MSEVLNHRHHLSAAGQQHYVEQSAIEALEVDPNIASAAHILVGERHGKFDLVHLVGYLLSKICAREAESTIKTEPLEVLRELLELTVKAGRRCAYDMMHAIDYPGDKALFHERAEMWLAIFNPSNGPKDYRARLHHDIYLLEREVENLTAEIEKLTGKKYERF